MKRTVFLLGAGAAKDWDGPLAEELTTSLITQGPKNNNEEYILNYIYEYFKTNEKDQLNFEGLIDILEQCWQFWQTQSSSHTINSKLIDQNNDFWVNSFRKHWAKDYNDNQQPSVQFSNFYKALIIDCYEFIIDKINAYSFYTNFKNIIVSDKNYEINLLANTYFKQKAQSSYLRVYNLNYDRIIQSILNDSKIEVFQGFNSKNIVPDVKEMYQKVDTKRILTSFNENCIYHLHGNFSWSIQFTNPNGLDSYEIMNFYCPTPLENNSPISYNSEKGRPFLLTPIITGYSKVQRTNLTPFKQMSSAFDIDCHIADELIIIGYSFGDLHINDTIRQARKANPKLKLTVLASPDPLKKEKFLHKLSKILLSDWESFNDFVFTKNESDAFSKQFNVRVIFKRFKKYLELEIDKLTN